ncbi:MAG: hypothetical protein FGM35_06290 [Rhodocyclaceae bacterium]|nr:hypothetical protein [Rhodocyclaceae bacterium]
MAVLSALKLTSVRKPTNLPQVVQRRNKLLGRIAEQVELANAYANGTTHLFTKVRTFTDKDTGVRKQVETSKRVKAWWFTSDNGKLALSVRYGAKVLELAKGKYAIEVATSAELVETLDIVRTAVANGELDDAIDNAANKLRTGFEK